MVKNSHQYCHGISNVRTGNIGTQLDIAYQQSIRRHNEKVDTNPCVFKNDCIKFFGAFELAFRAL